MNKIYIKDGQVSSCKVIYDAEKDQWISNPTEEMILALGWEEYVPVVESEEVPEEGDEPSEVEPTEE